MKFNTKKIKINNTVALAFALLLSFLIVNSVFGESISLKTYRLKGETLTYMRKMETMMHNFGEKSPAAGTADSSPANNYETDLSKKYLKAKQHYKSGMSYYYEGNYPEALGEFKNSQVLIEKILEKLSQNYIDRARDMMFDVLSNMHPTKGKEKEGISFMKITVDYGKGSVRHKYLRTARKAPKESRFYNPREAHFTTSLYKMENNIKLAYSFIGEAVTFRDKAINIEHTLEVNQKVKVRHRRKRINWYFYSINRSKKAKRNALNIFTLKYPFENDNHQLDKTADGTAKDTGPAPGKDKTGADPSKNVQAKGDKDLRYSTNEFYVPRHLNAVFDERIPETYRRDSADCAGFVYNDEFKHKVQKARWMNGEWMICKDNDIKFENCKPIKPE